MNTRNIISLIAATMLIMGFSGCSSSYHLSSENGDDVYFTPRKAPLRPEKVQYAESTVRPKFTGEHQEDFPDSIDTQNRENTTTVRSAAPADHVMDYYDNDDLGYDYEYSARIRRFHSNYYFDDYYHDYYTNRYWYSYDPFYYGTSIYISIRPWNFGHSYFYSPFNMYSSWYSAPSWGYYYPHNYWYGYGMTSGWGNPYMYNPYYSWYGWGNNHIIPGNSTDRHYYGPRNTHYSNNSGNNPRQNTGARENVRNASPRTTAADNSGRGGVRQNSNAQTGDRIVPTRNRVNSNQNGSTNSATQQRQVNSSTPKAQERITPTRGRASEGNSSTSNTNRDRYYSSPTQRNSNQDKPKQYNSPKYNNPRNSKEYTSPRYRSGTYNTNGNQQGNVNDKETNTETPRNYNQPSRGRNTKVVPKANNLPTQNYSQPSRSNNSSRSSNNSSSGISNRSSERSSNNNSGNSNSNRSITPSRGRK